MTDNPHFYLWINNQAIEGHDSTEVVNPFDGSTIALVSLAGSNQIDLAIKSSRRAFEQLRSMPRYMRADILRNMVEGLEDAKTEIIDALILEGGKPRMFAEQEFERTIALFTWAAEEAKRFTGECIPMDGMKRGLHYEGYTRREPIGPVLGICPFNFPLNLVSHKVAPALATGNPCLIKPSLKTPITALIMARIAAAAGAPPGSLNVLPMHHPETALLLEDDRISMLSFTGSAQVGWKLKARSGKKRVSLELGGNSGTIVDASADLAWAAKRCALGGFAQAGQSCIAVQRIYAHTRIHDRFLEELKQATQGMKAGDPRQKDTLVGPVIDSHATERILSWINEAVTQGARLVCGGKCLNLGAGNIIEPTILADVKEDMRVCSHEIFGPVVTVARFDHLEEAITKINHSRFGLQAAIFSQNLNRVQQAIRELEVGGVVINDFPTYRVDHMPYGGTKESGLGREGVRSAMLEMTEEKMVVIYSNDKRDS
jgi:glyceraldehyde-3-phosphate dehydrogenase (NADP+)